MARYISIPEDVINPVDPVTGFPATGLTLSFASILIGLLADARFLSSRAAMKFADRLEADATAGKMLPGAVYVIERDEDWHTLRQVADAPQIAFKPVVRRARHFFDAICNASEERPRLESVAASAE